MVLSCLLHNLKIMVFGPILKVHSRHQNGRHYEGVYVKKCQKHFGMTQHLHVPWLLACVKNTTALLKGLVTNSLIKPLNVWIMNEWLVELRKACSAQPLESPEFNLPVSDTGVSYSQSTWGLGAAPHLVIQENHVLSLCFNICNVVWDLRDKFLTNRSPHFKLTNSEPSLHPETSQVRWVCL